MRYISNIFNNIMNKPKIIPHMPNNLKKPLDPQTLSLFKTLSKSREKKRKRKFLKWLSTEIYDDNITVKQILMNTQSEIQCRLCRSNNLSTAFNFKVGKSSVL